jgi:hypothetical protein
MEQFNLNNYIKRMAGLLVSPEAALRTAINEEAKYDAAASVVLSNILNAMITACWVIYLNFKQNLVQFSLFKMVFKTILSTNVMFVLCVAGYFFIGRALGGAGTPMSVFISFGLVSVVTAAVSTIGNFASWLAFPATIINIAVGYVACREAHKFSEPKQVVITAVATSIAVSLANYIISFVIKI